MFGSGCSYWPTPTASDAGYFPDLILDDAKVGFAGPHDAAMGSAGQFSLSNAARTWSTLFHLLDGLDAVPTKACRRSSRHVRVSFRHGLGSYVTGLSSNPAFFEMVMGWPIGWTEPVAPVTEFAVWLQRSRGALCALLADNADAYGLEAS